MEGGGRPYQDSPIYRYGRGNQNYRHDKTGIAAHQGVELDDKSATGGRGLSPWVRDRKGAKGHSESRVLGSMLCLAPSGGRSSDEGMTGIGGGMDVAGKRLTAR